MPHWHEANRRDLLGPLSDCKTCMNARDQHTRQLLGCGYEPPPAEHLRKFVKPWQGCGYKGRSIDHPQGQDPKVCPGYTTNLPEVIEVARARMHWTKGELTSFVKGRASDALVIGIEILEGAFGEVQAWAMKPRAEGGGRDS